MQVVMQDIRRWGSLKILNATEYNSFINDLKALKRQKPITAYSVPKIFLQTDYKPSEAVMKVLEYCEPMINSGISNSEALQRKFRNTWEGLWKNFVADTDLDPEVAIILSDFGLTDQTDVANDLVKKYNIIVQWYLFSSSLVNLDNLCIEMKDIINEMVTLSNSDFINNYLPSLL